LRREERRAHILDCALGVFAHKGYHSSSVSDIIKKAGVARGTFYLYFKSKRAVFDELLDDLFALLHSKVKRIDPSRGPAGVVAQMESNIDAVMGCLIDNRPMLRLLMAGVVGLDSSFDKKLTEFYDRLVELTQRSLVQGHDMKVVRSVNAKIVSLCIIGTIKEVLYQIAMGRKMPKREVLVKEILDYGLRGLLVPETASKLGFLSRRSTK
jgi:AcrR family transcriptional regulator